ncbi:hypothetical protein SBOR_9171 [Sclerotinia borealis F-4128]|uniref:Uncharacterized protein n=1 Tax=Sclerotinia borealis (strain F-4128) TaxID=1432307 RepID=W9C3J9_SCLBF|nr:hypothetical protein SBOR_9171 [Sclerotinia borealis F-4128]
MGNCFSSRKQKEQPPRPPPGRRQYSTGTHNIYHTNPLLELLEEEYQSKRNLQVGKKDRSRRERYGLNGGIGPRRLEDRGDRSKSRPKTRQRAVRNAGRSRAIRPSKPRRKTKESGRKQKDFSKDDEDDSDSEDSEIGTSDNDSGSENDSDSDNDSDSETSRREMSKSVTRRRNQYPRKKRLGKRGKEIDEDEGNALEDEQDEEDRDDEEEDRRKKKQKKKSNRQNAQEVPKKSLKAKLKPKSKVKKVAEDDKIALLGKEDDENEDDDDAKDEEEQEEIGHNLSQESETREKDKGKGIEKPNPYRWTNSSPIFDKSKSSIYQRARAKGSDKESIRHLEIQRHRQRRERESSLKNPKMSLSPGTSDDDWTNTDASSLATYKRPGSTSSRLSSLFGPRNRSLTPDSTSHLMSPISPLTRPSISSKTGESTFAASVIRASPLQDIISADSLPANPVPNDTIITPPPPAAHQRPSSPLAKAGEPYMGGMKKVIFLSRGKRSSIKLVPSNGKPTDADDVEIILTK